MGYYSRAVESRNKIKIRSEYSILSLLFGDVKGPHCRIGATRQGELASHCVLYPLLLKEHKAPRHQHYHGHCDWKRRGNKRRRDSLASRTAPSADCKVGHDLEKRSPCGREHLAFRISLGSIAVVDVCGRKAEARLCAQRRFGEHRVLCVLTAMGRILVEEVEESRCSPSHRHKDQQHTEDHTELRRKEETTRT